MSRKITAIPIIVIIVLSALIIFNQTGPFTLAAETNLKIFIGPTSILADNNAHNSIFVQLQDTAEKPVRAAEDTIITLSSSSISIGTVDPSITIPKGSTYASANFYSTLTSGTAKITASASGYSTVEGTINTLTPIPSSIAVYGFPTVLPADGGSYPAIMVQLQDSSGSPQRAPLGGVSVTLSCSDTGVGTLSPSVVTIPYGQTYAIANFTTTLTPSTTPARIWTLANGYTSKYVDITTKAVTASPKNIKIFIGPPQILADNNSYPQVAIELQDTAGNIASASSNITVNFASWDPNIVQVQPSIIIGPKSSFQTYGVIALNTTYKAGTTTIIAAGDNLNSDQQQVTTVEFIPPKLAVFFTPPILPSDDSSYQAIQVQLQDSRNRPAKNPEGDVLVNLFSQHPDIATIASTLTIPKGKTEATGSITVTNSPGSSVITAQSSGYSTGQATITTHLIDFAPLQIMAASSPGTIYNTEKSVVTLHITADGAPVSGATISFTVSPSGGGSFTAAQEVDSGVYNATFTASSFTKATTCTITASASKTGYLSAEATTSVTVQPTISSATPTPSTSPSTTPAPTNGPTPSANSQGIIQLCIRDINDNPLNDTIVSSVAQPTGASPLFDITNSTGYVTFKNTTAGSYTFKIVKQGYEPMNATLELTSQPLALTITLLNGTQQSDNNSVLVIVAIIIVIVVVSSISVLFVIKRKNSTRVRKLQELQRQLKSKY